MLVQCLVFARLVCLTRLMLMLHLKIKKLSQIEHTKRALSDIVKMFIVIRQFHLLTTSLLRLNHLNTHVQIYYCPVDFMG